MLLISNVVAFLLLLNSYVLGNVVPFDDRKQVPKGAGAPAKRAFDYSYEYGDFEKLDSPYYYSQATGDTAPKDPIMDVSSSAKEQKKLDASESSFLDQLLIGYDQRIRPHNNRKPTKVTFTVFINSVYSVDQQAMDYKLNIFLRLRWNDPRLAHDSEADAVAIHPSMLARIWKPDVFFSNEKHANFHQVTTENKLLRVFRNGDIYSSVRLTLTLSCAMHLHNFPMDVQVCQMEMESFGFDMKDLIFDWDNEKAVQLPENLALPQFLIRGYKLKTCTKVYSTGSFTCLGAEFILQRQMGYYVIQMYAPSLLIVILSWVSFWINMDAAPARTALGITTVLTMTTQSSGARASLPKVSYIKAIDIWFAVCLIFVFAALLEFAAVNFLSRRDKPFFEGMKRIRDLKQTLFGNARRRKQSYREDPEEYYREEMRVISSGVVINQRHPPTTRQISEKVAENKEYFRARAKRIDTMSRVLFPSVFLMFNLIYWVTYQIARDDTKNILEGAIPYQ